MLLLNTSYSSEFIEHINHGDFVMHLTYFKMKNHYFCIEDIYCSVELFY